MIVVFGSVNVDLTMEMARAPALGQTVHAQALRMEPGGKGANQAVAAARVGAQVVFAGAVGRDPLADIGLGNLRHDGVDITRVAISATPTGCASVWVERDGANRIVVAAGANAEADAMSLDDAILAQASSVVLQMETSVEAVTRVLRRARACGTRTILNLAPAIMFEAVGECGLLVVNEDEAEALARWFGVAPDAQSLHAKLGTDVIRTLGSKGSEAVTGEGHWTVPAVAIAVRDTTAAGDCYVGVLAAGLDRGLDLRSAMVEATRAAALCCTRAGSQASLPTANEIAAFKPF